MHYFSSSKKKYTKYCDQCVLLFVCLSVRLFVQSHISQSGGPNSTSFYILNVDVAIDNNAICWAFPVCG